MFQVTTAIPYYLNLTQYNRSTVLFLSCTPRQLLHKYQLIYTTDCQNQSARDARYSNLKKTMSLDTVHESSSRKGGGRRGKCWGLEGADSGTLSRRRSWRRATCESLSCLDGSCVSMSWCVETCASMSWRAAACASMSWRDCVRERGDDPGIAVRSKRDAARDCGAEPQA